MRIMRLQLSDVGPFVNAELEFMQPKEEHPPVVLITGENGTGKSIILDAIREVFGEHYSSLNRDIRRNSARERSQIVLSTSIKLEFEETIRLDSLHKDPNYAFLNLPTEVSKGFCPNWIVDYWPSSHLAGSNFKIDQMSAPKLSAFLKGSLNGIREGIHITQFICYFDYLRDSRDQQEREAAEVLYSITERIFRESLLNGGHLSHVARATMEPMIEQNGTKVGLGSLSSGNLYLIGNLLSLLQKMYAVNMLREEPLEQLCLTQGMLLIDEAENQLHPKWQKRFIRSVLAIFPNLQIIATTHSPFIISSIRDARLFVCRSRGDHCVVEDKSAEYSNKPIDEILMSPLFEETQPFNQEITDLLERRREAITQGDLAELDRIETRLKELNPTYFAYLDMDRLLASSGEPNQ